MPAEEESFWSRVGILLVQGYGLTEASPIVTLNHPFSARQGSLGKPLEGQEVRLAEDGEILVRGRNVSTEYVGSGSPRDSDGWLRTGDLGALDEQGRLFFRGRKKETIVTGEGTNVFPEDVEPVLEAQEGIRGACVVGLAVEGREVVHAALITAEPRARVAALVQAANAELEPHQRIQSWSIWPEPDFPRTLSTGKVKRLEVKAVLEGRSRLDKVTTEDSLSRLVARLGTGGTGETDQRLEDLGLSSLDRIDLLARLELREGRRLAESEFAPLETVDQIRQWLERSRGQPAPPPADLLPMPEWPRWWGFRVLRAGLLSLFIRPLVRHFLQPSVYGGENLAKVTGPAILVANHASHLDTPVLIACLPGKRGARVAPAVRKEFFEGHFHPGNAKLLPRWRDRLLYLLACGMFNVFPLPQRGPGLAEVSRHCGSLVEDGYSILIFPEGVRSLDGTLQPLRPGAVLLAQRLELPLVPVYLQGLSQVMPPGSHWPERFPVSIWIGPVWRPAAGAEPAEAARAFEQHYRDWAAGLIRPEGLL